MPLSRGLICAGALSQALMVLSVILMATWISTYLGGFDFTRNEFNYHPFFMVLGFHFLYGEALLTFRLFPHTRKPTLKLIHAGFHISALIFAAVGLYAIFDIHGSKGIPHLYSAHSWLGLITVICFILQFLGGLFSFLLPVVPMEMRARVMPLHQFFGLAIYCLAIGAMVMGVMETALKHFGSEYSSLPRQALLCNVFVVLIVANGLTVAWILTRHDYRRRSGSDESIPLTQ